MRKRPISERFAEKYVIDPVTGCWNWTGGKIAGGYGMIGRYRKNAIPAHVCAYELHIGPVPEGSLVRHTCDKPGCVNPDHLRLGTHGDNMDDMRKRGRERVLTIEQVKAGVALIQQGMTFGTAADVLGVNRSTLQRAYKNAEAGDFGGFAAAKKSKKYVFLDEGQKADVLRLLAEGVPVLEVARRFGVDRKTIRNIRSASGR